MTNCSLDSWAGASKPAPAPTPPRLLRPGQFISYVKSALIFQRAATFPADEDRKRSFSC